jgi:hypothetical protein
LESGKWMLLKWCLSSQLDHRQLDYKSEFWPITDWAENGLKK